jgi:hypothetical protein
MDRRVYGRVFMVKSPTGRHTSAQVLPVRRWGYYFPNQYQLCSLERWDRGFESHSRRECLCAFIPFVILRVGSGLATGCSPVQGALSTVLDYETEKAANIQ